MKLLYCLLVSLFANFCFAAPLYAADTVPPFTEASLSPSVPDGNNGWYVSPVDVLLTSSDLESGVRKILWRLNGGSWSEKVFSHTLNMVLNPSFESDTAGWNFVPATSAVGSRTDEQAKLGNYSIKISSTENGLSYWTNSSSYVVVTPWETVSLGVWMKGIGVVGVGSYMNAYVITSSGPLKLYTSTPRTGTFDWVYENKDLVIASDSAYGLYFEFVLEGVGDVFYDGVYAAYASDPPQISFAVSDNRVNTLDYYAVDFAENIESTKSVSFKIDTLSPTNWQNFTTERAGNDHTLISSIDMSDNASGLESSVSQFQYSVLYTLLWGYFTEYDKCKGEFLWQEWLDLDESFSGGDLSGTVTTPAVDYCNSNWLFCKGLRFKVVDMAGNDSTKEICINGPWSKVLNGDVISLGSINMTSSAPEFNTNGLVISSADLSNFSSSAGWEIYDYNNSIGSTVEKFGFSNLKDKYPPDSVVSDLPTADGIFETGGDFYVDNSSIPGNYSSQEFTNVLFVNGDLVIGKNIDMHANSGTIFVVKDDVLVHRSVTNVGGFFLVGGTFDSSYNGGLVQNGLNVYGGVFANKFSFSRSLLAFKNETTPSEVFEFDPKYLIDFPYIFGNVNVRWREVQN